MASEPKTETACDRMEQDGRTLIEIATALRQLPDDETRLRVIRSVAALYGVNLGVRR